MKLSIILPVYNVESYLRECLDSIYEKDIQDFELIAINDGSTDKSLNVLQEYENRYDNFSLISQSNKGLSVARNIGLSNAKGKYVYFFDSDDILSNNGYILNYIDVIEDFDILIFNAEVFEDSISNGLQSVSRYTEPNIKGESIEFINNKQVIRYNGNQYLQTIYQEKHYSPVVWKRVYKRDFLVKNNISFYPRLMPSEDDLHLFQTLFLNPEIVFLNESLVFHRIRKTSIMSNLNKERSHQSFNIILFELLDMKELYQYKETNIKVIKWIINFFIRRIHSQKPSIKEAIRLLGIAKENGVDMELKTLLKILINLLRNKKFG